MAGTRAAIRYAKAILDTAHESGIATDVNNDMVSIANAVKESRELREFLLSPTVTTQIKQNALLEIFAGAGGITTGLFRLLFENKRFEILEDIALQYTRLFEEMNGIEVATVTTAFPMDAALEGEVLNKILTLTNKKVVIKNTVDPAIIGGFVLRIGDRQYNASLAGRLEKLKRELSN
jgi:F-type H+-transporting ATPase subunit delta